MIDWLLNVLYNIGMAIGAIIVLIGVIFYLSTEAEYKNPNVANQRMLQELRKLNRLQREQIELEKEAQLQALAPPSTQWKSSAPKTPGFWDRMNAKLESWDQRLDEQAAQKKQARLAKKSPIQQTIAMATPPPLPQQALEEKNKDEKNAIPFQPPPEPNLLAEQSDAYFEELVNNDPELKRDHKKIDIEVDLDFHIERFKLLLDEYIELAEELPANFWEDVAALKAEFINIGQADAITKIQTQEAELMQLKKQLYALVHSRMFPPVN